MQTTKANALYAGADLHGNNVFLSLCNKEGGTVFRKRVKANLAAVNAALDPFWKRIVALGVESTFNWYWFVDGLRVQTLPGIGMAIGLTIVLESGDFKRFASAGNYASYSALDQEPATEYKP